MKATDDDSKKMAEGKSTKNASTNKSTDKKPAKDSSKAVKKSPAKK
jgi:hypothetical protein